MKKILIAFTLILLLLSGFLLCRKYGVHLTKPSTGAINNPTIMQKILLGDNSKYENLTSHERGIVNVYYDKTVPIEFRDSQPISGCILKYYDQDMALIGCSIPKPTLPLNFYDINNNSIIYFPPESSTYTNPINLFSGYGENENYLISIYDDVITYYKIGDKEFKILESSKLLDKKETYVKQIGMAYDFEFSFTKDAKTLKVSIFKNENKEDVTNTKQREVEFVLP